MIKIPLMLYSFLNGNENNFFNNNERELIRTRVQRAELKWKRISAKVKNRLTLSLSFSLSLSLSLASN